MKEQNPEYPPGTMRLAYQAFEALRNYNRHGLSERGYTDIGLTDARVLQHVVYSGGSLSEIARKSKISRQAVAKTAAQLERQGYLRLKPSTSDRRASVAELTAKGKKLFAAMRETIQQSETRLEQHLGTRKLEQLRKALLEIANLSDDEAGNN